MDTIKDLIRAACHTPEPTAEWERRTAVLAIARAEEERLRRQSMWAITAAAACFVGLLFTLPVDTIIESVGAAIGNL